MKDQKLTVSFCDWLLLFWKVAGYDGAWQIAAYLKSQRVRLEFLVDEGTMIVKDAVPGIRIPFALWVITKKKEECP